MTVLRLMDERGVLVRVQQQKDFSSLRLDMRHYVLLRLYREDDFAKKTRTENGIHLFGYTLRTCGRRTIKNRRYNCNNLVIAFSIKSGVLSIYRWHLYKTVRK